MTWDLTPNIAAGFFDGDGTVDIVRGCITARIAQSCRNRDNIVPFMSMFGGSLYTYASNNPSRDSTCEWTIRGAKAYEFLKFIEPSLLKSSKRSQISSILSTNFEDLRGIGKSVHSKSILVERQRTKELLKVLKRSNDNPVDPSVITDEYAAGFFTAEGCVARKTKNTFRIVFSQKDNTILHALRDHFRCGNINGHRFELTGSNALRVMNIMLSFLGPVKRFQVELALSATKDNFEHIYTQIQNTKGRQLM